MNRNKPFLKGLLPGTVTATGKASNTIVLNRNKLEKPHFLPSHYTTKVQELKIAPPSVIRVAVLELRKSKHDEHEFEARLASVDLISKVTKQTKIIRTNNK